MTPPARRHCTRAETHPGDVANAAPRTPVENHPRRSAHKSLSDRRSTSSRRGCPMYIIFIVYMVVADGRTTSDCERYATARERMAGRARTPGNKFTARHPRPTTVTGGGGGGTQLGTRRPYYIPKRVYTYRTWLLRACSHWHVHTYVHMYLCFGRNGFARTAPVPLSSNPTSRFASAVYARAYIYTIIRPVCM